MGQIVQEAPWPPYMCAVTRNTEGPFYDTQHQLPGKGQRVYFSQTGVGMAAETFGLVPVEKHREVLDRISELKAEEAKLLRSAP